MPTHPMTPWADLFFALGDPTRLALLATLAGVEGRSITALAGRTGLTRQAVAKHLGHLARAGLVASRRVGRETLFAFRPEGLDEARGVLADIAALWDDARRARLPGGAARRGENA